jgi:DNA polymerase-3 subunit epsilon
MIALASKIEFIETPTILEAEIRELRLIGSAQPRFNRRSRFQNKAYVLRLTSDDFPRVSLVKGLQKIKSDESWVGPFSSRDEAIAAQTGIYETFPIRQCTPRITLKSMRAASPCALLDLGKCGAPCIGLQSSDSYKTVITELRHALEKDARTIFDRLDSRMKELALSERFEEAAEIRNRLLSLIKGVSRSQRIVSLKRIKLLIVAVPIDEHYEVALIKSGSLIASRKAKIGSLEEATAELSKLNTSLIAQQSPSHEEIEIILRFLNQQDIKILEISDEWSSPLFGGEQNRQRISEFRNNYGLENYKEALTISWERLRQR